jgi:hypothetical protein
MVHCEHTQNPAQEHEHIEKLKFLQTIKNGSERTHPGAVDPVPQGGGADPKIHIGPMSKDLTGPSVELHIAQLHGEGTVRTTWPWIHPHGSHPLTKRLNLAVEKGPRKVHTRQPLLPQLFNNLTQGL